MSAVTAAPAVQETSFRAMGSDVHALVVDGPPGLVERVQPRFATLEARWSRFRADSELSRLNAAAGQPVLVSPDTFRVVAAATGAWRTTGGRFDPTVLPALVALGYDDDLARVKARPSVPVHAPVPAPGCAAIRLDPTVGAVTLPPGVALDLGGIGKGFAADLVVDELLAAGAAGACVNAGGDLRVGGTAPDPAGWSVAIAPLPDRVLLLGEGGVATSSAAKRRWDAHGTRHHLVDPTTGTCADRPLGAVTIVAGTAAAAEVLATAVWLAGPATGAALVAAAGATGLVVTPSSWLLPFPGIEEYLR